MMIRLLAYKCGRDHPAAFIAVKAGPSRSEGHDHGCTGRGRGRHRLRRRRAAAPARRASRRRDRPRSPATRSAGAPLGVGAPAPAFARLTSPVARDRARPRSPARTSCSSPCRTASRRAVAAALPDGVKVVDLGADHRLLDAAAWTRYYGGAARRRLDIRPARTARRSAPRSPPASRVAAPGCYATAITLALAPLIAAGVADPGRRRRGRRLRHLRRRPGAKAHLLGTEVMGDAQRLQGRRAPARTRDQAGDRRAARCR